MSRVALVLAGFVLVGCSLPEGFVCTTDSQCGTDAICTPRGACARADATCPAGLRFVRFSPESVGDQCADFCAPRRTFSCSAEVDACEELDGTIPAGFGNPQQYSSVAIDNLTTCRGAGAARFTIDAATGQSPVAALTRVGVYPNPIYLRAFARFSLPSTGSYAAAILEASGPPNGSGVQLVIHNGTGDPRFATNHYYNAAQGIVVPSTQRVLADHWYCLELGVSTNADGSGTIRVFIDEHEIEELGATRSTPRFPDAFQTYALYGAGGDPDAGSYQVWFDGLAVDGAPIGCRQ